MPYTLNFNSLCLNYSINYKIHSVNRKGRDGFVQAPPKAFAFGGVLRAAVYFISISLLAAAERGGFTCRFLLQIELGVVTHEGAVIGKRFARIVHVVGEHHNCDRLIGVDYGAVIDVGFVPVHRVAHYAVFVREVKFLLVVVKVFLRLGFQHSVYYAGEALAALVERFKAVYLLLGREVVIEIIKVVHIIGVNAHILAYRHSVRAIAAEQTEKVLRGLV